MKQLTTEAVVQKEAASILAGKIEGITTDVQTLEKRIQLLELMETKREHHPPLPDPVPNTQLQNITESLLQVIHHLNSPQKRARSGSYGSRNSIDVRPRRRLETEVD